MSFVDSDLAASAAQLYYIDGQGQHEIASILGVSRPKVSRLLTQAREQGIVRISVERYDPRDQELERRLEERFGLSHVVVVRAQGRTTESVRHAIGYHAAPVIAGLLRSSTCTGLAGGRTLAELVDCLPATEHRSNVQIVQLMGHVDSSARRFDASELGRVLSQRTGGSFSILAAPAFAPNAQTRNAFLSHTQIRRVYQQFETLDVALVGVGTLQDSVFAERGVLNRSECAGLERQGAVGEICGRFFDREGLECVTGFRDRVLSIGLDQVRRCREVIAVTNGASRKAAVLAAIRGGLINSLVLDDLAASALLEEDPLSAAHASGMT